MSKEENVLKYYVLCHRLKDLIRTGWKQWHVQRERLESVAEHIYGTQMLAIAIKQEYEYDIDLTKVLFMLAIHELGETIIGDLTFYQITEEDKKVKEHEAVHKILDSLLGAEYIEELFLEFDNKNTKEAIFAYQCDKAECDIQCKLYDEEGCVDPNIHMSEQAKKNPRVHELLKQGKTWSDMWLQFDLERIPYDDNFKSIIEYTINNKISKL